MDAREVMLNYKLLHRAFASKIRTLQERLMMLPSTYDVPDGATYQEHGREITKLQDTEERTLREIRHAIEVLTLRMQFAQVNLKAEWAMCTIKSASHELEQLKREKTQ